MNSNKNPLVNLQRKMGEAKERVEHCLALKARLWIRLSTRIQQLLAAASGGILKPVLLI